MSRPAARSRSSAARAAAPPSVDGFKALRSAVDAKRFEPVYYLHGNEEYLKEQSLRELLDAALDPSTRDFNCEIREASALDAETLGSLLGTPPMLAARRAVVVRDVAALKKAARAPLERYLASPAPDTLLVLVAPAGSAVDVALAQRTLLCEFAPLSPERVRQWIAQHAVTMLGVSITDEAAALLQQSVGTELQALVSELDKCASFVRGAQATLRTTGRGQVVPDLTAPIPVIDDAAVSAIVGVRRGETAMDLLDAILHRDTARAIALLPFVLAQPKANPVQLVMMLSTHVLAVSWARARRDGGVSSDRLAQEFIERYVKPTGGSMISRPWGEAVSHWTRAVEQWTAPELRRARRLLLEVDIALKDTRISNEEQLMASLVLALGRPARRQPARGRAA
jgi:DNA polymerase-3 subunit delta